MIKPTELHFHAGRISEASDLVRLYHYSSRPPANVRVVGTWHKAGGLFGDAGEAIAACFFSLPPTRWSEPVLELSRLVRKDDVRVELTALISMTCRYISNYGEFDLLVSFADVSKGHHGGIYQAASWRYGGKRESRVDGIIWNGAFIPGRSANSRWGTRSPSKLAEMLGPSHDIKPHLEEGKHIYWKPLRRSGEKKAAKLGLQILPYPKPSGVHCGKATGSRLDDQNT